MRLPSGMFPPMATPTSTYRRALAAARTEAIEVLRAAMRATTHDDTGAPTPTPGARLAASTLLRLAARDLDEQAEPAASDSAAPPASPPPPQRQPSSLDHPPSPAPRPAIHNNVEDRPAPVSPATAAATSPLAANLRRAANPTAAAALLSRAGAAPGPPPPRSRSPAA